jgi:hypothetical protein
MARSLNKAHDHSVYFLCSSNWILTIKANDILSHKENKIFFIEDLVATNIVEEACN